MFKFDAPQVFNVYVSRKGMENLDRGITRGVWGWKSDAVQKMVRTVNPAQTGLTVIESIPVGAIFFMGAGGPSSRVAQGGWSNENLGHGYLCRVTRPYYLDDVNSVWDDEMYPHRIGIDVLDIGENVSAEVVGVPNMEALRLSANTYGLPFPTMRSVPMVTVSPPSTDPNESDDPFFEEMNGDLDGVTIAVVRREQRKLRSALFGGASHASCALCGRQLPINSLRAAHIKKRSVCDWNERLNGANVMAACVLGCDHLFELGYIAVDTGGTIVRGSREASGDILNAIEKLTGNDCSAFNANSEGFFTWHITNVAGL